jgi:polygalacturonase
VQAKLRQYVSAQDFGVTGNGTTNDTAAIQNAVETVQQGTVYLPPGVYRITAPITLRPGLSLVGEPDPTAVGGSTLLAGADIGRSAHRPPSLRIRSALRSM